MCFLVSFCPREHCATGCRDIKTLERQQTFERVYLCLQAWTHVMINKYGRHLFCDHIWSFDLYVLINLIMKTFSLVLCYVYTVLFSIQCVIVCLFSLSTQHWVAYCLYHVQINNISILKFFHLSSFCLLPELFANLNHVPHIFDIYLYVSMNIFLLWLAINSFLLRVYRVKLLKATR